MDLLDCDGALVWEIGTGQGDTTGITVPIFPKCPELLDANEGTADDGVVIPRVSEDGPATNWLG